MNADKQEPGQEDEDEDEAEVEDMEEKEDEEDEENVWEEVEDVEDDDDSYWDAVGRKTQRVAEHPLVGTLSGQIAHILM